MKIGKIKSILAVLIVAILITLPIGVLAQKPTTEMKIFIKDDGTVTIKYSAEGEFETNETGTLNLEAYANVKFDAKEVLGNVKADLDFESAKATMQQQYFKFEIELKGMDSGQGSTYTSKVSGTVNVAFSRDEKIDELKIELENISTAMDENNITTIEGTASVYTSDPMLLMFLMALNKDKINEKLNESNIDYIRVEKLEITVTEKNTVKIDFTVIVDMNKLAEKAENKESEKAIWNLIRALKHEHTLDSSAKFSLEMDSRKTPSKGTLSFEAIWHYKGDIEALKEIFSETPAAVETTSLPQALEDKLSKEDIWELGNATKEFLENVEISYPSEVNLNAKINVANCTGRISLSIVAPPLKAKGVEGAEGAKTVLKYLGNVLTVINDKLEKLAEQEERENVKAILKAIIPEKVSLEPYGSEKYIVKIEPKETSINELGEVSVEIVPKTSSTQATAGAQMPMPTETLGILAAIIAITVIGAVLLKRK